MKGIEISKRLSQFNGIYLSGFFISNPSYITALSLLFDKIYLPNNIEFVVEFAKQFEFQNNDILDNLKYSVKWNEEEIENGISGLLSGLNRGQTRTVHLYLLNSYRFLYQNRELFPTIFETNLIKEIKEFKLELMEKMDDEEQKQYTATLCDFSMINDGYEEISSKIGSGFVPVLGTEHINCNFRKSDYQSAKSIATLLAMKSIEMIIPPFKESNPETILEARDRLSDFLPPFWSAMLKFSVESKNIIHNCSNLEQAIAECQNIVDVCIRPTLIDLNEKLVKENKYWFYKILSHVGKGVKLVVGKPQLTNFDLLATSISCSTDIGLDYMNHRMKIEALKEDAGLTYLLKLGEFVNNSRINLQL